MERPDPLPEGVGGYLDWVTGIMRIEGNRSSWTTWLSSPEGYRCFAHEYFHALQFACCGYLYATARKATTELHYAFSSLTPDHTVETLDFDQLRYAFDGILHTRPSSLSMLDIIESAAYLFDSRVAHGCTTASEFRQLINEEQPPECYTIAFCRLEDRVGSVAFETFPSLAYISLCASDPVSFFEDACHNLTSLKRRCHSLVDVQRIFQEAVEKLGHALLGASPQIDQTILVPNAGPIRRLRHPVFGMILRSLAIPTLPLSTDAAQNILMQSFAPPVIAPDVIELMCSPKPGILQPTVFPPILFDDGMMYPQGLENSIGIDSGLLPNYLLAVYVALAKLNEQDGATLSRFRGR